MPPAEDIEEMSVSLRSITRIMHSVKTHKAIQAMAGTEIDKLSEVILMQCIGDPTCQLRISDIAERAGVELSGVSRKVHKLESNGLVEKVSDPGDGRAWRLRLTDAGATTVKALADARADLARRALAEWSAGQRETFTALLARFADDLHNELENLE